MSLISVEEQLFFILSNPIATESDIAQNVETISQGADSIDFDTILKLAIRNGTAGFLYKNTRGLQLFPKKLESDLRSSYRHTVIHNLSAVSDTLKLLSNLSANNIAAIPLKGAHASDVIFEDFGVYPFGDIDVLVKASQLSEVKEVLCEKDGYSQAPQSEEDLLASHYHLMFNKKDHLLVEVHWNLVKRYVQIPPSFWWEDHVTETWWNVDVPLLTVEKYLMYTVFRLFDHCYYPFRFFVLIAGIIGKYSDEIDWDKLLDYCTQYKMKKMMVFTLQLLEELLKIDIPDEITQKKIFGYRFFKKIILSSITSDMNWPHLKMMAYTMLLDSPFKIVKILFGRVFPPKEELRLRYNLQANSMNVYFYYLLNPLYLLFRK